MKSGSLFNDGLCPVVYSTKQNQINGQEWIRDGFDIKYFKGDLSRDGNKNKPHYTLTFSYYVHHSNDTIYFAHSFPYTFTDLKEHINSIMKDEVKNKMISVKKLCKSLAGNICEQLTITSNSMNKRNLRKGVVIFARQHPGETGGSYMMQGCIDFLLGDSQEAEYLRENCVFKIVPMLNPDGVIHGNYRCSLAGCDLNRRWKKPRKKLHPTVYYLKEMIKNFKREREIKLIVDLHGHSRKMNTFFYGCSYKEDPVLSKVFPFMMSKLTDYISFDDCRFKVQKSKEKTARISLWKDVRVQNVFTLEASFYGKQKNEVKTHYSIQDFFDIGSNLLINLYNFLLEEENDVNKSNNRKLNVLMNKQKIMKELKENEQKFNDKQKSDSDGSDSDPSEDELPDDQIIKLLPKSVLTKKQKLLLAQEEERLREKREKEQQSKRNQKKNDTMLGNQSDTQDKKRLMTKFFARKLKAVFEKKPEVIQENKIQMVDAEVQTDASYIMELRAQQLLKKQSLYNVQPNGVSYNRQVPSLMNNPQAKKENQLFSQQISLHQQRQSLQLNFPQNSSQQIKVPLYKQIENLNTVQDKFIGSQSLRGQNSARISSAQLKLRISNTNSSKQNVLDDSLKDKVGYFSQTSKNDGYDSNRYQNNASINNYVSNISNTINSLNTQRDTIEIQKPKTPSIANRPYSIEGSGINPNRQIKNLKSSVNSFIKSISPNTPNSFNNTTTRFSFQALDNTSSSNTRYIQSNNSYAINTLSVLSPKNDSIIIKKSTSQVSSIVRTRKTIQQNQNQDIQYKRNQKTIN